MKKEELTRFLLVEDNDDHAELILQNFEENRLRNTIERVSDGETALKYLRKKPPYTDIILPDVVLLDIRLPGISGIDVLTEIKNDPELKTIPVVILTTSSEESDRARAYDNYVNSYLTKPLDFQQFQQLVRELKLYWGIWNQPA